jgi:hypothetical protein
MDSVGAVPVPEREVESSVPEERLEATLPELVPMAVGVNLGVIVQVPPLARVPEQVVLDCAYAPLKVNGVALKTMAPPEAVTVIAPQALVLP